MDIIGITTALQKIQLPAQVEVYLSNGYVVDSLAKGWLEKWRNKGFKKRKHADRWKELDSVIQKFDPKPSFHRAQILGANPNLQRAEQLAKAMSGKKNLPVDIASSASNSSLFEDGADTERELSIEDDTPILDSICVDAATTGNPGPTEYRGVDTKTGNIVFQGRLTEATNNIGEFVAIVHALALVKKEGRSIRVIYSDSQNAISWVRQKTCKTKFDKSEANAEVFKIIDRAVNWLNTNSYATKVLKWNTGAWGEIKADYGRK
jgi:ribonuclease HI